jgi:hypothetical protein
MLRSDERTDAQADLYNLKTQVRDLIEDLYSADDIFAAVDQLRDLVDDLEGFGQTVALLEAPARAA